MAHLKHKNRFEDSGVNLGLIITPFLDVAFQLLAFFIMTYHPSALEAHIDGSLVPPDKIAVVNPNSPPPPKKDDEPIAADTLPDVKDVIQVMVKAVAKGQIEGKKTDGMPTRIYLKLPEGNEIPIADVDTDFETALKRLSNRLTERQKDGTASKTNINITADGDLKYEYFIRVQDTCKAAKFNNIGFTAPIGTK